MSVSYKPLKHLLIDRELTLGDLRRPEIAGLNSSTVTRLNRDEYVSLQTIEQICEALACDVQEVLCFTKNVVVE